MTSQKNVCLGSYVGLVAVVADGGGGGALLFSRKVAFITLNSVQGGSKLLILWMES